MAEHHLAHRNERKAQGSFCCCPREGRRIRFQPTNASAKLFVTDSIMDHNGISTTTGGGIGVVPGGAGSANVHITNTKLVDNSVGMKPFSSGGIFVAVQGGMVATNDGDGIRAVANAVLNLTITGRNELRWRRWQDGSSHDSRRREVQRIQVTTIGRSRAHRLPTASDERVGQSRI
jgi:hypothetical protein